MFLGVPWDTGIALAALLFSGISLGISLRVLKLQQNAQKRRLRIHALDSCFTSVALSTEEGDGVREELGIPPGDPYVVCAKIVVSNTGLVENSVQSVDLWFERELADVPKGVAFWFPRRPQDEFDAQFAALFETPPPWRETNSWGELSGIHLAVGASSPPHYIFHVVKGDHLQPTQTYPLTLLVTDAEGQVHKETIQLRYADHFIG